MSKERFTIFAHPRCGLVLVGKTVFRPFSWDRFTSPLIVSKTRCALFEEPVESTGLAVKALLTDTQ